MTHPNKRRVANVRRAAVAMQFIAMVLGILSVMLLAAVVVLVWKGVLS